MWLCSHEKILGSCELLQLCADGKLITVFFCAFILVVIELCNSHNILWHMLLWHNIMAYYGIWQNSTSQGHADASLPFFFCYSTSEFHCLSLSNDIESNDS